VINNFIKHVGLAKDKYLLFLLKNLLLIFVITCCKIDYFVGLPPIIIPKHLKIIFIELQFKTCEYIVIHTQNSNFAFMEISSKSWNYLKESNCI